MKKLFLFVTFSLLLATSNGQHWQQKVDVVIEVTLNDKEHSLDAFEKITYTNNSPDTLNYVWFHLWPNAYKNDKTAFSYQFLENGNTSFYFSDKKERGYINRLDFKVAGFTAKTEDHPNYIDIIKVLLPAPLAPYQQIIITTPFHVQLPAIFSRSGHRKGLYQVTQWYPKPAVYDAKGWHPMPYLDQGEFYSEFGDYNVSITLPKSYTVAATGNLQSSGEMQMLKANKEVTTRVATKKTIPKKTPVKKSIEAVTVVEPEQKTLLFTQNNIHDFAFFADSNFSTQYDTCQLASGKIIDVFTFYTAPSAGIWKEVIPTIKEALRSRSQWTGDYPYNNIKVVEGYSAATGGMEYPTVALTYGIFTKSALTEIVEHEIGHNWFYGALASNERQHPWMDEGMNTFYDLRQYNDKYEKDHTAKSLKINGDHAFAQVLLRSMIASKRDQPMKTASEEFSYLNYGLTSYNKAAQWLSLLQDTLGKETFDKAMKTYFEKWSFKHPYPEDFKNTFESISGKNLSSIFHLLQQKGALPSRPLKKWKVAFPLNVRSIVDYAQQPSKNVLLLSPIVGYNKYDKLMVGMFASNFKLPQNKFGFMLAPLYATNSKQLTGLGKINYHWFTNGRVQKINIGLSASKFATKECRDSLGSKVFQQFYKVVPAATLTFKQPHRSSIENKLEWKTFFIGEKEFSKFVVKSSDGLIYVDSIKTNKRYVNNLTFTQANYRVLYPYDFALQLQQGKEFYRLNVTANYFFNYAKGGGLNIRAFAAKFGYMPKANRLFASRYMPKLLGVTGEEDYTYSNYFIGRTASYANAADEVVSNKGVAAQQIMIRDGGFKLRADQFEFLHGRSANWVAALNFNSTLPQKLFPFKLPLKLFVDVGTFAEAWDKNADGTRLQYIAGLQLSLLKDLINIYAPVLYSATYRNNLKAFPELNTFTKRLTFSIDVHRLTPHRVAGKKLPFL